MEGHVYLNGAITPKSEANISVDDAGLLYGMGLFETMRCSRGRVFAIDEHLQRLFASAEKLSITIERSKEEIKSDIQQTIKANKLTEARVRLTYTTGITGAEKPLPTLLITAVKFEPYPEQSYSSGILAVLSPYRQNPADPLAGHKSTCYHSRLLALRTARSLGAVEAIWFTVDNKLAEGCVSNIFLVKDEKLLTPSTDTPVLPGVARSTVIKLAEQDGIKVEQKDLNINDLLGADEVFITNVMMKVMPVVVIEKHAVGDGKVGKITSRLTELYDRHLCESVGR